MTSVIIIFVSCFFCVCSTSFPSCLHYKDGRNYNGEVNKTTSGKTCKPWSFVRDKYSLSKLNIKRYEVNFCRNPNGSQSLWCFTSKDSSEYCHVPLCQTNPEANFCIIIPKIHFKSCPAIFRRLSIIFNNIQDFNLNVIFCCVSNNTENLNLLPQDSCVIAIVRTHVLQEHFAVCPNEFYAEPMKENVLESNVIYKCCKSNGTPNFTQSILHLLSSITADQSVLASILSKYYLCPKIQGLVSTTHEYHGMDQISRNIFPSKMILCFYFKNTTKAIFNYSQLGFLTYKKCPIGFKQSNNGLTTFMYGSTKLTYCWPQYPSNLHYAETFCLNVKALLNSSLVCSANFQEYYILSVLNLTPLSRLCCRCQNDDHNVNFKNVTLNSNTSMAFITPSNNCSVYKANMSMRPIIIKSSINKGLKTLIHTPLFLICVYELQNDEFAYKKIGHVCPEQMFSSKALFKRKVNESSTLMDHINIMDLCVGNGHFTAESFPKGNYCLYKISSNCPPGFKSVSHLKERSLLNNRRSIPDYNGTYICCRNDGQSTQNISLETLPFLNSNNSISFGLILQNYFEHCPIINGYISFQDFDFNGPFCAYRSKEEYYRWKHEIIWPNCDNVYGNRIQDYTVRHPWIRSRTCDYRSSTIHRYARNQFCILSQGSCLFIQNLIIKYPIKDFFLCCCLKNNYFTEDTDYSFQFYNNSREYFVGYLAVHGKCPHVDENLFILHSIINDTFHIKAANFENEYGISLMKIGIIPDITSIKETIKVEFKFCLFKHITRSSYEDQLSKERFEEFIKPVHSFCPMGYRELKKNISLDLEENLNGLIKHFITGKSLSLCIPLMNLTNQQRIKWPSSLCRISQRQCSQNWNDYNLNINDKMSMTNPLQQPFYICCPKMKITLYHNEFLPQQFALPLTPAESKCPQIQRFLSVLINISLSKAVNLKSFSLCFYYQDPPLARWPTGSYLTISYDNQCPLNFQLAKYNKTTLCMRKDSTPSLAQFPEGNYCILTFIDRLCPPTVTMRSRVNFIGLEHSILNLCCSLSTSIIFNIPTSKETAFSFISVERCSIIPGMHLQEVDFRSFQSLSQCIYTSEKCQKCLSWSQTKSNIESSLINRQNIIISLLVFVLIVITGVGFIIVINNRMKEARSKTKMHFKQNSEMKLSAIYTQIDSSITFEEEDNSDDDVASVAYSTIL